MRRRLTVRVGRNAWKSSRGAKRADGLTHVGRFAALRYNYTIVRGGRDAALRDKTPARRASSGRSEGASASSDPYSKTEFYRMILPRVDGCNPSSDAALRAFARNRLTARMRRID